MENPCRELRELLKMSQVQFSGLIGRSYQSLKVYEKHPTDTPTEVIERLKSLAAERGFADWAIALSSDDWRVNSAIYPIKEKPLATVAAEHESISRYNPAHRKWHDMLETILQSGDDSAIGAVEPNLIIFYRWVTERIPTKGSIPKKKRIG